MLRPLLPLDSAPRPGHSAVSAAASDVLFPGLLAGWRLGWAIAPKPLAEAIGSLSAKMIDSPPAPFQEAAKAAFALDASYYSNLQQARGWPRCTGRGDRAPVMSGFRRQWAPRGDEVGPRKGLPGDSVRMQWGLGTHWMTASPDLGEASLSSSFCLLLRWVALQEYRVKRDFVVQMLREAGLIVDFVPQGGVFVYARIPSGSLVDDVSHAPRFGKCLLRVCKGRAGMEGEAGFKPRRIRQGVPCCCI